MLPRLTATLGKERNKDVLHLIRAFSSGATEGSGALGLGARASQAQGHRSPDNRLSYVVADTGPAGAGSAMDLLEKSLHSTPVIFPSPGGPKTRYLKLPQAQVCSRVLQSALKDSRQVLRAAELAEALLVQGVEVDAETLGSLVAALTRRGKVAQALAPLDRWLALRAEALDAEEEDRGVRAQALALLTGLVDAAARAEDTVMLQQVLSRMANVGLMPRMQSITSLLQCFMRLGQPQVAHSILEWMRRGGLQPNVFHYTSLMAVPRDVDTAGAARLLLQAKKSYGQMEEDGVQPNARFFTAFIRLCGRARDLGAALQAWQDLQAWGIQPDAILYSALIDACAKCQSPDNALQLFESMKAHGVRPDVVTYASLLAALHGPPVHTADARKVWADMTGSGVEPNSFAVAAYLNILLTGGEIDEALELLNQATQQAEQRRQQQRRRGQRGQQQGGQQEEGQLLRLYAHFMQAMDLKGQHSVVQHLARHMRARGLRHTAGTAAALLTSQAMQHEALTGRWLLSPEDVPSLHNAASYYPAQHGAQHAQHAQHHHPPAQHQQHQGGTGGGGASGGQLQGAAGRQPLDVSEAVVNACLLGQGSSAEDYAQRLMAGRDRRGRAAARAGPSVTLDELNLLIGGLATQGHQAKAFELYEWAQLEGLRPNAWTLRLLMFAALNAPPDVQFELLTRVLAGSRLHVPAGKQGGRGQKQRQGSIWCQRTRSAILAAMRQSNKVRELLGDSAGSLQSGEESEAKMQRVLAMLGQR